MAMNKAEKYELAQARRERDLAVALRFRTEAIPEQLRHDELGFGEIRKGWHPWVTERPSGKICPGCFSTGGSSLGLTHKIESRTAYPFYATRLEALIVLREMMTVQCAEALAELDRQINTERESPTPIPDTSKDGRHAY